MSTSVDQLVAIDAVHRQRQEEGLVVYRPNPTGIKLHNRRASEILARGGNQCLAAGTQVMTPGGSIGIEDIRTGDQVIDEHGNPVLVRSTFQNGPKSCVRLTGLDGHERFMATCTREHSFLLVDGDVLPVDKFSSETNLSWRNRGGETGSVRITVSPFSGEYETHDIHVDSPTNLYKLANGLVTHNSGKTTCAGAEVASAATGMPIIGSDGKPLPRRFPEGKPLLIWVIGYDQQHIGGTLYRKLFTNEDSMWIVDDLETGEPRLWNPYDPEDMARKGDIRNSGPLIPNRFIDPDGWAWENKGERVFTVCRLLNGTEIRAFSSGANCPQGIGVDIVWIDEDVKYPEHYPDWRARIVKKRGTLFWTAFPWARNDRLQELSNRANDEADNPDADICEFQFRTTENQYLEQDAVNSLVASWAADGEIVLKAREAGEFPTDSVLMYPSYSRDTHGIDESRCPDSEAARVLQRYDGVPPDDWMRVLALDPGSAKCAVLFAAVPPPDLGDHLFIYDEVFLRNTSAEEVANETFKRVFKRRFRRFIIDNRMGRQSNMDGVLNRNLYLAQFKRLKMDCEFGYQFSFGDDRPVYRSSLVRSALRPPDPGTVAKAPKLMIWLPNCPQTTREFGLYKRRIAQHEYQDEPIRANNDAMNCFDSETEVLTGSGWMRFADAEKASNDKGVLLATVNLELDQIELQEPTRFVSRIHDGEMVSFGGSKMDALVTPNHRMVVYPTKGYAGYDEGRPVIKPASEISKYDRLKLHAQWNVTGPSSVRVGEKEIPTDDWCNFLGWYLAEGCCDSSPQIPGSGYRVTISQTKPDHMDWLGRMLDRLPWNFVKHKDGFSASSKELWTFLEPIGNCYSKRVPRYVMWFSAEQIEILIDSAIAGDGHVQNGQKCYYTASKGLADDMQELFIRTGKTASVTVRKQAGKESVIRGKTVTSTCDIHCVREWRQSLAGLTSHEGVPNFKTVIAFSGNVFCATVPNGTLIVRRNGRPVIAGNCLEYIVANDEPYSMPAWPAGHKTSAEQWVDDIFGKRPRERGFRLGAPVT